MAVALYAIALIWIAAATATRLPAIGLRLRRWQAGNNAENDFYLTLWRKH